VGWEGTTLGTSFNQWLQREVGTVTGIQCFDALPYVWINTERMCPTISWSFPIGWQSSHPQWFLDWLPSFLVSLPSEYSRYLLNKLPAVELMSQGQLPEVPKWDKCLYTFIATEFPLQVVAFQTGV
jgi:hypothetical protein